MRKYTPFFASAMLMYLVLLIIYPHYRYYIDPDGTSYLTISQRYADGDYQRAVNSFWSPLSCWLTALFIKGGIAAIPASWMVNTIGATGFLFIAQSFFLKFNISGKAQRLLSTTLSFFLCYAIFWQSFDDLWEACLLLVTLRLMLAAKFKTNPLLWVVCGVVGAAAYFAKSYAFPFFILNTVCCTYLIAKGNKVLWLKISFVAISTMGLCSLPWIYALHHKYGIWTTSTAGSLNMAWFLVGHPYWRQGINLLLPPVYNNSPYYWEDPYVMNGAFPHFWDSWRLMGKETLRIGFNSYKCIVCMLQLSVFVPVIGVIAIRSLWLNDKQTLVTGQVKIMVISCLLLPLGYLLATFETRYLWYMLPLVMILGVLFIRRLSLEKWRNSLLIIFPVTFLIYPVLTMKKIYNEGANDYRVAKQLKKLDIHGSFASMAKQGTAFHRMARLAYFSGNQLYSFGRLQFTGKDLLKDMRRYHVNYFFVYNADEGNFIDEQGKPFPEITKGSIAGLRIYLVNSP